MEWLTTIPKTDFSSCLGIYCETHRHIYEKILTTSFITEVAQGKLSKKTYYAYLEQDAYFMVGYGIAHQRTAYLISRTAIHEYLLLESEKMQKYSRAIASAAGIDITDRSRISSFCQRYITCLNPSETSSLHTYSYRLGTLLPCSLVYLHMVDDIRERPDSSASGYEHCHQWFISNESQRFREKVEQQIRVFARELQNFSKEELESFNTGFHAALECELEFFHGVYNVQISV